MSHSANRKKVSWSQTSLLDCVFMHLHLRFMFTLSGILTIPFANAGASSVSDSNDSSELLESIIKECAPSSSCELDRAENLWMHGNCREREVAFCIFAEFEPHRLPVLAGQLTPCPNVFPLIHAILGSFHYYNGDFQEALNAFANAEQEGHQRMDEVHSNLGATYFATEQWEFAITCFEDAWMATDKSNVHKAYMTLNNLAAIHLAYQKPELALAWVEESKSNLDKMMELSESMPSQEMLHIQSMTIAVNEFWARGMMRDTVFLRENWRNIDWGSPGIQGSVWLHLMTEYSSLIKEEGFYASQSRLLYNLLNEIERTQGESDKASELSDLLTDYNNLWPDDLAGLVMFWKELDDLKDQFNSTRIETPNIFSSTRFKRNALFIANAILCCFVLFLIFHSSKSIGANDEFLNQQLQALNDWPNSSRQVKQQQAILDSLSGFIPSKSTKIDFPEGIELSELEFIVLQSAAAKERPKELAIRKNLSPSYIYALRSSIRKKLGISEVENLESWIEMNKNST